MIDRRAAGDPVSIAAVSLENGARHYVTEPPATALGDASPAISPDGRYLAFHRVSSSGRIALKVVPVDRNVSPRRLAVQLESNNPHNFRPTWWPDSQSLVFYAKISAGSTPVWRVSTNTGDEAEVLGREWGATDFAQHLYFIPMADANWKRTLMRMDLLSGEVEQISVLRSGSATPICSCERRAGQGLAISPDGKTILFGQVDQIDFDVMLVDGWR